MGLASGELRSRGATHMLSNTLPIAKPILEHRLEKEKLLARGKRVRSDPKPVVRTTQA